MTMFIDIKLLKLLNEGTIRSSSGERKTFRESLVNTTDVRSALQTRWLGFTMTASHTVLSSVLTDAFMI